MDKMRELFLEKFLVPRYGRVIATGYADRLDTPDTLWVQQDCWEAFQAAQSAAVPVHAGNYADGALYRILDDLYERGWVDKYKGRDYDPRGTVEWQAVLDIFARAAVPVVGEPVALICDDCGAETNDPWHSSKGTNRHYHRCDSCNSIAAAVPEHIRAIRIPTDTMEQEFQLHYRRGYEAGRKAAVPVVDRQDPYDFALDWRRIDRMTDRVCDRCGGSGIAVYGDTSTWRGGIGGQSITSDVCDVCWGSGLSDRPWPSRRSQTSITAAELERLQRCEKLLIQVRDDGRIKMSREFLAEIDAAIAGEKNHG